jgi:hypothetical protein
VGVHGGLDVLVVVRVVARVIVPMVMVVFLRASGQ